ALAEPSFPAALAALLHVLEPEKNAPGSAPAASSAVQTANEVGERWRLSNKERELTVWLLEHYGRLRQAANQPWSAVQPLLVDPGAADLIALHESVESARGGLHAAQAREDAAFCRQKLALPKAELDPPPLLTGNDLLAHGVPKGVIYKRLLAGVRAAQLDGKIRTRDEALALVDRLLRDSQ
ncbi:MAG TPA: hypothetical protein VHD36_17820, partial [Pirellulales bacterium]|nr:hypothetical protein [Pirellulales bacterium]